MRIVQVVLLLLAATIAAPAASTMSGDWDAVISAKNIDLRLALHVVDSGKGLKATLDRIPIAAGLLRLLVVFSPDNVPRLDQVHIDGFTLAFTAGCSIFAGLLFGLAPALRSRDFAIAKALANGARGGSIGGRHKLRSALAVAEIAMAVVLLSGAGLLLRSFMNIASLDPGFDPRNVLTFSVALPADKYEQPVQANAFSRAVLDRIHRFPLVTHAAVGASLPTGPTDYTVISRRDAPPQAAGYKAAAVQIVSQEYQPALGIALKRGRLFEATDVASSLPAALINPPLNLGLVHLHVLQFVTDAPGAVAK